MPLAPRRRREDVALGGQQAFRLTQLRLEQAQSIHAQHLRDSRDQLSSHSSSAAAPPPRSLAPIEGGVTKISELRVPLRAVSRTVEAVVESRAWERHARDGENECEATVATRLRDKIRVARGGSQTERCEYQPSVGNGLRQRIVSVRRRACPNERRPATGRKLTREEMEWMERQRQFTQRVGMLEKECLSWWRAYYASASSASVNRGPESRVDDADLDHWRTATAIQKLIEESEASRNDATHGMQQQLKELRSRADHVAELVQRMRDGSEFFSELQGVMDELEQSLADFRLAQREQYDGFVMDEKLLERELGAFLDTMDEWEQEERFSKKKKSKQTKKASVKSTNGGGAGHCKSAETLEPQEDTGLFSGNEEQFICRMRQLNQELLRHGGVKGGWEGREHAMFTTMLTKSGLSDEYLLANSLDAVETDNQCELDKQVSQSPPNDADYETKVAKFIRKCTSVILTKTDQSVRRHLEWYVHHLSLQQAKKLTIQQWRDLKASSRQQFVQQGLDAMGEYDANGGELLSGDDAAGGFDVRPRLTKQSMEEEENRQQQKELEAQERARKNRRLAQWRAEKQQREEESQEQENDKRLQREALEAKRQQEQLLKKEQLMMYKQQKEQEAALLQRARASTAPQSRSPASSPEAKLALEERSRQAIEKAKSRRARLEELQKQKTRQQQLPARPTLASRPASSPTDSENHTLLKPTKAFEARHLSKMDVKKKTRERERKSAHDTYFPGSGVTADVKLKSFGHIAIAPRAVPSWRRNL